MFMEDRKGKERIRLVTVVVATNNNKQYKRFLILDP